MGNSDISFAQAHPAVERWLSNFPGEPKTQATYLMFLRRFVAFTGKDPEVLVREAKADADAAHEELKRFRNSLAADSLSSGSVALAYSTVRSFYKWNRVKLPPMPRGFAARVEHEAGRLLKQEEVAAMFDCCRSHRERALFLATIQSEQRIGLLCALKVKHIQADLEAGGPILVVNIPGAMPNKKGVDQNKISGLKYRFVFPADATRYIRLMLEERRKAGEPIDGESWLFRSYGESFIGKSGKRGLRRVAESVRGPPLVPESVNQIFKRLAEEAGIQRRYSEKRFEVHAHIARGYVNNALQRAGLSQDLREMMMGHKDRFGGSYNRWPADAIKKEWMEKNVERYIGLRPEQKPVDRLEMLKEFARSIGLNPAEVLKRVELAGVELSKAEELKLERLRDAIREHMSKLRLANNGVCLNGNCESRLISEDELVSYLNEGWDVVKELSNGKIAVRRRTQ